LYQPKSVIIHFEGKTAGIDTSKGIKKYQEINKARFQEKWKAILEKEHYPPATYNIFKARERTHGNNILVIDQYLPKFDYDAGSRRMFYILNILSDGGNNISFINNNFEDEEPYKSLLQQMGVEILYDNKITLKSTGITRLINKVRIKMIVKNYLKQHGKHFDLVIISREPTAIQYIDMIRQYCPNAKIIYDTVDLAFLRESRHAKLMNDSDINKIAKISEQNTYLLMNKVDVTWVVSPVEKEILLKNAPNARISIVPTIHKMETDIPGPKNRVNLMFVGGFLHEPNVDGIIWFVTEVFPLILQKIPGIKLFVIGSNVPQKVLELKSSNVVILGYVKETKEYFDNCRLFIAPLRFGAGIKGKINESMSYGLPVVTTSIGAEGMQLVDGNNCYIADDPNAFCEKVTSLYFDDNKWNTFSENGIKHVNIHYSYSKWEKEIKNFIASTINNR
jgi:O-antigen biosynthesis protein